MTFSQIFQITKNVTLFAIQHNGLLTFIVVSQGMCGHYDGERERLPFWQCCAEERAAMFGLSGIDPRFVLISQEESEATPWRGAQSFNVAEMEIARLMGHAVGNFYNEAGSKE